MLTNYFKVAFRNLLKHRTFAAINVMCLAIGLACCILILLFVQHEWRYDKFHQNAGNLYRLVLEYEAPEGARLNRSTLFPDAFAEEIAKEFPSVVRASSFIRTWIRFTHEEKSFTERVGEVDQAFLEMFTIPLLAGDPAAALRQPDHIVISSAVAQKFFGETAPAEILGKVLAARRGDISQDFIIAGVMSNVPETSSLQFDVLIPIEHYGRYGVDNNWAGAKTVYVQLAETANRAGLEAAFPPFVKKQLGPRLKNNSELSLAADLKKALKLRLQPLAEIHLDKSAESHYLVTGNAVYSVLLAAIALLILFIACVNFMTLSIGRSAGRALEVGLRKVLGATRPQVIRQFWGEAILLSVLAMLIGLVLAELFLPIFNTLAQKKLALDLFGNFGTLLMLLAIMLATGLFAGSYPALVLSRFQPAAAFKSANRPGGRNRLTNVLVILQYALAIVFMIATGMMSRQLAYLRSKDLGYAQEHVVLVTVPGAKFSARFKNQLAQHDRIISAGASDRSFTSGWQTGALKTDEGSWQEVRFIRIDENYLATLNIKLLSGRNFSAAYPADTLQSVIVNETFVKTFGWPDPLGKPLADLKTRNAPSPPAIIGVVQDFHIDGLQKEIAPLVLHMNPDRHGLHYVFVRIRPEDVSGTIALLQKTWEAVAPNQPFNLSFLNENLEAQYRNEQRWQKIVVYAAIFAIIISCLGLLGLTSLAVTRRTKEIGVRKVLGATVAGVVGLLSKDFLKPVLFANVIAWPAAYVAMNQWLQNFAYRVDLGWWVFARAGGLALLVALLTVSAQAIRAALANPAEALRYE